MGQVNSFGEDGAKREGLGDFAGSAVNSFWLKSARNLGVSGPPEAAGERWKKGNGGGSGIRTHGTG